MPGKITPTYAMPKDKKPNPIHIYFLNLLI
jgi:hypothetical protein